MTLPAFGTPSMQKPFVQACENNKHAIADALQDYLRGVCKVLEIGSGTGQHISYFAERFAAITWQASDICENLEGIRAWLDPTQTPNALNPIELNLNEPDWTHDAVTGQKFDAIYLSNVVHIIETRLIRQLFIQLGRLLEPGGLVFMYGPFNYGGRFTSEGNRRLDAWLKAQHSDYGVRDFEYIDELAREQGLSLLEDITMPANNRLLVWRALN